MKSRIFLGLIVFLLSVVTFPSLSPAGETVDDMTFQTLNQSLWGPGVPPDLNISHTLINEQWDFGESHGAVVDGMDVAGWFGLGGVAELIGIDGWLEDQKFGGAITAGTEGEIEARLDLNIDAGSVDAGLPARVVLKYPDPNTFAAGGTITVNSSCYYPPGGYLNTEPPGFSLYLGGKLGLYAGAGVSVCIFDCLNYGPLITVPSGYNVTGVPLDLTLISLTNDEAIVAGKDPVSLPYTIPFSVSFLTGISGYLDVPEVTTTSQQTGSLLTATGEHKYIDLTADLDSYLTKVTKVPLGFTGSYGGATVSIEGLDVDLNVNFTEQRNATFQPVVWATLDFERPVELQPGGVASKKDLITGNGVSLVYPDRRPLTVQKSFFQQNDFHHDTKHVYAAALKLLAGKFQLTLPSFSIIHECIDLLIDEVCIDLDFPGTDIGPFGPIWQKTIPLFSQPVEFFPGIFGAESWQLGGFSKHYAQSFVLDPESPGVTIRKEASKVINNGGGTRTIVYTVNARNAGDVPLKELQIYDALSAAFPAEWADYTVDRVHSCELKVNPGFDGTTGNDSLLEGTDILDDGYDPNPPAQSSITGGTVVVVATVVPRPFPPVFTNEAVLESRSWFVGTPIGGSSSAEVDLGPARIEKQDDFVLYADRKIMFKDTEFIRGHVGSNGTIEVQNGDSGTVAGDLRAIGSINIHGHLIADYAFTNQKVYITENGELDLSGGIVEHQAQPYYNLPAVRFSAGGPDIIVTPSKKAVLPPGRYGNVRVMQNAELTLSSGNYFFRTFQLERNATALLDATDRTGDQKVEPININIVNIFRLDDSASFGMAAGSRGTTRDVVINVMHKGDIAIGPNAVLRGILTAPDAKVTFRDQSTLEGAAYARFISLEKGVNIQYHDDWNGELYRIIDMDCDGNPDNY